MSLLLDEMEDDLDEDIIFSPSFVPPSFYPRHAQSPHDRTLAEIQEHAESERTLTQFITNQGAILL